jgi:lysophospholipase L1-like esterase
LLNRTEYVPDCFDVDERKRGFPVLVTLWGVGPSRNRQRTVSPSAMRTVGWLKSMFFSVTDVAAAPAAGAASARRAAAARRKRMHGLRLLLVCGSLALAGCGGGAETMPPATTAAAAPGGVRYAVIGDSYSNGEAVGVEGAWPTLLAQRMGLDLVANPAVSGWTAQLALGRELPEFTAARPEVATLLIGANDLVQGVPPKTFRARFRRLLRLMVQIVGEPRRVVAVTVPDFSVKPVGAQFGEPSAVAHAIRRFNAIVRTESAAQDVPVADVFTVSQQPTDPSPDGLHPSARELEAWTDAIEPVARRAWHGLE